MRAGAGDHGDKFQLRDNENILSPRAKGVEGIAAIKGAYPLLVAIRAGAVPRAVVFCGGGFGYPVCRNQLLPVPDATL